ncbi:MAG: AAA family ATPase [Thermodesulfobacteriota bacterium]
MTNGMTHAAPGDMTTAPLANVSLCYRALQRAMQRPAHLPGMVCFYGPSGFGKSTAATYAALKSRAYYIECKSTWSRKAVLAAILQVMGIQAARTIYEMADQVCEQLATSERPLIIDEMDHLVDRGAVEIIRDLYEGSGAAILIIGEERLPNKLKRWERFHGRILDWVPAQPADYADCEHLARLYCREVSLAADLLKRIHDVARGSVRRICVNLERVQDEAAASGLDAIDLREWGSRDLYTGEAPARRL